jgi:hypothetical protein
MCMWNCGKMAKLLIRQTCCHDESVGAKHSLHNFGPSVSGWDLLWRRINPFAQRLRAPSLFGSIMRTVEINDAYRMKSPAFRRVADLLIDLPLCLRHWRP